MGETCRSTDDRRAADAGPEKSTTGADMISEVMEWLHGSFLGGNP
jgi:hypothetical protein